MSARAQPRKLYTFEILLIVQRYRCRCCGIRLGKKDQVSGDGSLFVSIPSTTLYRERSRDKIETTESFFAIHAMLV